MKPRPFTRVALLLFALAGAWLTGCRSYTEKSAVSGSPGLRHRYSLCEERSDEAIHLNHGWIATVHLVHLAMTDKRK